MNGSDVLIYVKVNSSYVVVGSQRNATVNKNTATYDVSSKDTDDELVEPGRRSSTLDMEAVYVPNDAAYEALDTAYKTSAPVYLEIQENDVATETATAYIESFTKNFPDQDASTYSMTFHITGGWEEAGT